MKSFVRVLAASAVICGGVFAGAAGASASGSTVNMPASGIFVPIGALELSGPGVKVASACTGTAFSFLGDPIGFSYSSGSAVFYQIPPGGTIFDANGGNIEGTATLVDLATGEPTSYTGHTHLWFGQNSNNNGQFYEGATLSFNGSDGNGSSVTISANPGFIQSASGHQSGWGQEKITCS